MTRHLLFWSALGIGLLMGVVLAAQASVLGRDRDVLRAEVAQAFADDTPVNDECEQRHPAPTVDHPRSRSRAGRPRHGATEGGSRNGSPWRRQ